jgi:hypothetical protein
VPSPLQPLIEELSEAAHAADSPRFHAVYTSIAESARNSSPGELTAALEDLAPLLYQVVLGFSKLAVLAGALVEWGGSPLPLSQVLSDRALDMMQSYAFFPVVWKVASGGQELPDGRTADDALAMLIRHAEQNGIPREMPLLLATSWFYVEDWIKPMLTAMGDRAFRAALSKETLSEIRQAAAAIADRVDGAKWLQGLTLVLDDEPLIVLDGASGRGFRLTMSGIGDNYQLHTLLADRLSGQGLPGLTPPQRAWVAQATDAPPVPMPADDSIRRRFRLFDGTGAYVYPEGRPADIGVTDGTRVLVLHPPNGNYGWVYARAYPHMTPTLTLDGVLSDAEAADWRGRIAPPHETDIMAVKRN